MSGLRAIADVGGTNARFAVANNGTYSELVHVEVSKYASLHDAFADYLIAKSSVQNRQATSKSIARTNSMPCLACCTAGHGGCLVVERLKRRSVIHCAQLHLINQEWWKLRIQMLMVCDAEGTLRS